MGGNAYGSTRVIPPELSLLRGTIVETQLVLRLKAWSTFTKHKMVKASLYEVTQRQTMDLAVAMCCWGLV